MRRIIILLTLPYSLSMFAAYVVDVTFSGDTNNFSTVEIHNGKGLKEFDSFIELNESEKIGIGEEILISDFKVIDDMPALSISGSSNQLKGFKTVRVKGKRRKYPIIKSACFSIELNAWYPGTWLVVGGGVNNGGEDPAPAMIRIRKITSGKDARPGNKVSHTKSRKEQ